MTLDQVLALVFFGAAAVCGIALYIDGFGGWTLYRAELRAERRRKKRAARVRAAREVRL